LEGIEMGTYPKRNKKTGTYFFVLETGKDVNGGRKRVQKSGFKTVVEAKLSMEKLMLEFKN
jgi:hypothetical protein